jgi:hypothetical protein
MAFPAGKAAWEVGVQAAALRLQQSAIASIAIDRFFSQRRQSFIMI